MASAPAAVLSERLILGRYLPVRPLGSGGSGSVWLARDQRSGLDVALKIVSRDGRAASRAEREAAVASRLRHERCQRAYALARDDEHVYIAYEYVPGKTLRETMRAGELPDAAAIEAAAQVLEALAHAHARGIVHRDVKPANVLLASSPGVSVRLLDFGLAQFAEAETLTAAGDVPGTLAYIAPERLKGEPGTPAADVWSVGVLLWEALAGRHPFWAASLLDTARNIQAGAEALTRVRPDLPAEVTGAVEQALSLDPEGRPTAAALAKTLRPAAPRQRAIELPSPPEVAVPPALREAVPRAVSAVTSALVAGWTAAALPFYPGGAAPALALAAAVLAYFRPRAGLAFTLSVPILPLGNASLGLALAYTAVALGWAALFARDARAGIMFALGPLLAPIGALGLLPLVLTRVGSAFRRAALAGAGVLTAAAVSSIGAAELRPLRLGATADPLEAVSAVAASLAADSGLVAVAASLAAAAALLGFARSRGPWGLAVFAAAILPAAFLVSSTAAAILLVASVWLTAAGLTLVDARVLERWAK